LSVGKGVWLSPDSATQVWDVSDDLDRKYSLCNTPFDETQRWITRSIILEYPSCNIADRRERALGGQNLVRTGLSKGERRRTSSLLFA